MFGSGSNSSGSKTESNSKEEGNPPSPESSPRSPTPAKSRGEEAASEKTGDNGSPPSQKDGGDGIEKKRRSSSVGSKASNLLASARNSLNFGQAGRSSQDSPKMQSPLQKLGRQDPALAVPQGQHNNSAGEAVPGPRSTFRVGVWEDRNRRCRRTMEDTHAFLYDFLDPHPLVATDGSGDGPSGSQPSREAGHSDNGYFAIFDGHAGTFAADWCGKKLHIILEDVIRKNPTVPIPELLDQTFTTVDAQLEKLPLKNSGCTAAIAVLRWEERVPVLSTAAKGPLHKPAEGRLSDKEKGQDGGASAIEAAEVESTDGTTARPNRSAIRQRILYTANVGDARIVLCRGGKALRLSYDHKGGDENEGKRIANAGGLILNNRVNGVLAVTRALGDSYIKHLVTGHPYTTETVVQSDLDEFIIIACDGLWDVCSDEEAVDLVRDMPDPAAAARHLVDHALSRFSTDNLSCMIVRFDKEAAGQGEVGAMKAEMKPQEAVEEVSQKAGGRKSGSGAEEPSVASGEAEDDDVRARAEEKAKAKVGAGVAAGRVSGEEQEESRMWSKLEKES